MINITEYADTKDQQVSLSGGGGKAMNILASGDIDEFIENVYEVSDNDHGVLSLSAI